MGMPRVQQTKAEDATKMHIKIEELRVQQKWLMHIHAPQSEMDRIREHIKELMDAID